MGGVLVRIAAALAAPLLLVGCILTPGKFDSKLTLNADRSFTFAYKGEVIAIDPGDEFASGLSEGLKEGEDEEEKPDEPTAFFQAKEEDESAARKKAETEAKRKAVAEALAKEHGYRSVQYVGEGKYLIDYEISGVLSHNFVFPYNSDAEAIFPFLSIERRSNGTVRVRAPGFAAEGNKNGAANGMDEAASKLDGVFTLDTDAEIVSQNNEDGATTVNGRKLIRWRATPLTKDAPLAVVRVKD